MTQKRAKQVQKRKRKKLRIQKKENTQKETPPDSGSEEQQNNMSPIQQIVKSLQEAHQARDKLLQDVLQSLRLSTANPARKREVASLIQVSGGLNDMTFNSVMDMLKMLSDINQLKAQLFMLSMHVRVIEAALVENDVVTEDELKAGHQKFQEEIAKEQEKAIAKAEAQKAAQEAEQQEAPQCKTCDHCDDKQRCQLTENRTDDWYYTDTSPDWCPLRLPPKEEKVQEVVPEPIIKLDAGVARGGEEEEPTQ